MSPGDKFQLQGYELVAVIDYISAPAVAVVVHNNSTHLLVAFTEKAAGPLMARDATLIESFRYAGGNWDDTWQVAYSGALHLAIGVALGHRSDGI